MANIDSEIKELHLAVKISLDNQEILMRDIKDVKFVLIGNEMDEASGLIKEFRSFKTETKESILEHDKRIRDNENYQTGMKWAVRIGAFTLFSGIVLKLGEAVHWFAQQFK